MKACVLFLGLYNLEVSLLQTPLSADLRGKRGMESWERTELLEPSVSEIGGWMGWDGVK